jgi:hypothetical protein
MMLLDARGDKEMISFGGGSPDPPAGLKPLWREMSRELRNTIRVKC